MSESPPKERKERPGSRAPEIKEIKGTENYLEPLLEQLLEKIERGEFAVILSEDASGRIPTLIMAEVINKIYDLKGYPHADIRFAAGFKRISGENLEKKDAELQEHLRSLWRPYADTQKRLLVVTDTIDSGHSIRALAHAIRGAEIPFDVATLADLGGREDREDAADEELERHIYAGAELDATNIYGKSDYAGVEKNPEELFSHSYKKDMAERKSRPDYIEDDILQDFDEQEAQKIIHQARGGSHLVAERLFEKYKTGVIQKTRKMDEDD